MGIIRTSAITLWITLALAGPANWWIKKPENNLAWDGLKVAQTSNLTILAIKDILNN